MARPRKSLEALQGAYTKEDMQSRIELADRLKGNNNNISPPDFVLEDEVALEKFYSLVQELTDIDIINNVDVDLLAVYSDCWSKYIKATKMLALQSMVDEQDNKMGGITRTANPYLKIQQSYSDRLMKISSLFGLSPADRSKIAHLQPSDKTEKADPLAELLGTLRK